MGDASKAKNKFGWKPTVTFTVSLEFFAFILYALFYLICRANYKMPQLKQYVH